ncbi:hypothetical protein I580_01650 [Enterococcus caccae ATCC BAA-1240]|uniref:Molybdopterin-guanine dinucleotide biosynthesis protein B (MobB) domain-containing protein n=2 Tax=Enterococcus caccae TaxID=317735 RepID=R3WEU6_9ENTE|nr:hypothetical protein UC7_01348 [Enterococcus caccae ATCC BAA-1240]EOT60750.1 hypothetical protein I580_01650 [Enterococcus caccae ATCC BAA-1240]OJG27440.1 hypothetical protein RU98_GL002529 [Enterococcus caccae]
MVQIGSTGRNSGKTTIAKRIIAENQERFTIYGLKIITISGARGKCQRGETGCGICTSIDEGYELIEERNCNGVKDTMQLLKAGCKKVYLLKVFHDHLLEGFLSFLQFVPRDTLIVCESNSIREVVKPGLFLMMNNQKSLKKTAANVIDQADIILETSKLANTFNLIKTKNGIRFSENSVENRRVKI